MKYDSRDFKDAESVRSGLSHVTSQPALLTPFRDPGGMLSRSVECQAATIGRPAFGTRMVYRETFSVNPTGVFFSTSSRRIQSLDS